MAKYLLVLFVTLIVLVLVPQFSLWLPAPAGASRRPMATIQDVALHAGVSVSTVSNVLNGRTDRMRPQTLERVQAAIRTLQFTPSKLGAAC